MDIIFEQNGANDLVATVVLVAKESGQSVNKGEHLFDVETSKAIQAIDAPASGFLVHSLSMGQSIRVGSRMGTIVASRDGIIPETVPGIDCSTGNVSELATENLGTRLSRDASKLASELGLTARNFSAPFVTKADVLRYAGGDGNGNSASPVTKQLSERYQLVPLPFHKQSEHRLLRHGAGNTMLSVVGSDLRLRKFSRPGAGFFENRIVDVVAHEASKLMIAYPKLNAAVFDSGIRFYDQVNVGIAFDGASRLVVYGLENSNNLTLTQTQAEILKGFKKYVRNDFHPSELSRATFTVTDLSTSGVDFLFPLLPSLQTSIIGIASSSTSGYRLFVGFDHRVTEGLETSQFLQKLCENVAGTLSEFVVRANVQCSYCGGMPIDSDQTPSSMLIALVDSNGHQVLCCKSCWRPREGS